MLHGKTEGSIGEVVGVMGETGKKGRENRVILKGKR